MDIPKQYNPGEKEEKWYNYWLRHGFFHSTPDEREPYTIVIPPPNVTGVLHMGHMLNNTLQDVLVRRARMRGYNACWVPGTDHASIATEAKVVEKLRKEGVDKNSLSREEFLKHAWDWTEKHGGIILEQLKKLGASCDWERTRFTMDEALSESVLNVFIDLYSKDLIYRGVRMVNWDPRAKTAISDEEVIYREVQSKLYYIRYRIEGTENEWVTIATTRPETILGDTAVCVNPADERFKHLHGKRVLIPLINRPVPIILDDYVDMEFGTGCLKITPAHDENDYEIGIRHNLESIDILNDDGTLNDKAQIYVGQDRFEVRKAIAAELQKKDFMVKTEDYMNKVGYSERTDVPIEPKLSMQWFLRMKEIAKPALDNVLNDNIQFHPPKFKNFYRHWMENVRDWCISRQLWWGHRIPAYYIQNTNDYVVAASAEEALEKAREKTGNKNLQHSDLQQDEDALDTWFSSWLWPVSVFDGIRYPDNEDIKYYYPTNDLITAPEILFFWVARMIMAGYEYRNDKPFKNVYLTGIVRDTQRRKMSKSLGNSPDPLELMKKYSADGVRVGMLLCSPAGNDLLYEDSLVEQGRNFGNKIWNVFRLIQGWEVSKEAPQNPAATKAIEWFENQLSETIEAINHHFDSYRISDALMALYKLVWDEFSSWYLEMVKPAYQQPIDHATYTATVNYFEQLLHLLHPFMPFITEEIWQFLGNRRDGDSIVVAKWPKSEPYNSKTLAGFNEAKEIITKVRAIRKEKQIAYKEELTLQVLNNEHNENGTMVANALNEVIKKGCNVSDIEIVAEQPENAVSFIVKQHEYYIPLEAQLDVEAEIEKLQAELDYTKGFLKSVMKKLNNERFVNNAPATVVEKEQTKRADAEAKIKTLEERIASFS